MTDFSHTRLNRRTTVAQATIFPVEAGTLPRLAEIRFDHAHAAVSPEVFAALVRIAETAIIVASGFLIAALYVAEADFQASYQYLTAPLLTAIVLQALFQWLDVNSIAAFTNLTNQLARLFVGWTAAFALLVATVFFLKAGPEFSRVWLAGWYFLGFAALLAVRLYVQTMTQHAVADGRLARRAVIYGGGDHCAHLLKSLEADPTSDLRICGIFDDRSDNEAAPSVAGYPVLGGTQALVDLCRRTRVDMIIVALPLAAEARVSNLMKHFRVLPADIRIAASASELRLSPNAYSYVGSVPMLSLSDKPISGWGTITKTVFDKVVATLALILLSPVMLAVALAVKFGSKGPVLFRQKRYGFNNELIEVLKFRSMYTDQADASASRLVTKDDPRVTPIGRFIRKASLDELPQLLNVLGGTLSLVGPRPHALQAKAANALYPDVVDGYFARHKVKPGITGWAQINGWRGETDTPEKIQKRVEHDLYYIENWSLLLDIYILAKTPLSLLKNENAY
jgi:Undecaprenyl-phosphate glucose phosphotransferase